MRSRLTMIAMMSSASDGERLVVLELLAMPEDRRLGLRWTAGNKPPTITVTVISVAVIVVVVTDAAAPFSARWRLTSSRNTMGDAKGNSESPAPLTPAVFHILLALADGPLHGYAIMGSVADTAGLQMGPGTIYGSIQRMEDAGLLRDSPEGPDGAVASDRRRYYRLTDAGREALMAEAARLAHIADLVRDKDLLPRERPSH
jgi:DNA-binding PadR family transcriptional regulator